LNVDITKFGFEVDRFIYRGKLWLNVYNMINYFVKIY